MVQGDCLKYLPKIPDENIDLIVTDPPYNVLGKTQEWDDKGDIKEYMNWTILWLRQCYRVLKQNTACYVFWSQKYIKEFLNLDINFRIERMLVWHHSNLAKPTNKMYLWTYDPIFYLTKGKPNFKASFSEKENVDVFQYPKPQSNWKGELFRFHPTSKPVELIKKLIKPTTQEGSVVLDPFLGSGTTMLACLETNRNCIGIEIEPKYVEICKKRLNWGSILGDVEFKYEVIS